MANNDPEHHADLLAAVFAMLTARLEDAAGLAAEGQGRLPCKDLAERCVHIAALIGEAETLTGALIALIQTDGRSQ